MADGAAPAPSPPSSPPLQSPSAERARRHDLTCFGPEHAQRVRARRRKEAAAREAAARERHAEELEREARAAEARREHNAERSRRLAEHARERREQAKATAARKAAAQAAALEAKAADGAKRSQPLAEPAAPAPAPAASVLGGGSGAGRAAPRYSALHKACAKGDLEAVNSLLSAGASPTAAATKGGHSPIEIAASAGHYDIVQRLLRCVSLSSERERQRCARLALRGGHKKIAALVAPRASKEKVAAQTPAQLYAASGVLGPGQLRDGFFCSGERAEHGRLLSLAQYTAMAPNVARGEVVLVDARQDRDLHAFVERVAAEIGRLDSPDDLAAKVALCQRLVCARLGVGGGSAKARHNQDERSAAAMWSLQRQRKSRVVSLGSIRLGTAWHRALLLKYLADSQGVAVPCRLVRGEAETEAWVEVHYEEEGRWVPIGKPERKQDQAAAPTDDGRAASGSRAASDETGEGSGESQEARGESIASVTAAARAELRQGEERLEAALDLCLAFSRRDGQQPDATWQLLMKAMDGAEGPEPARAQPPRRVVLSPQVAALHTDYFSSALENMQAVSAGCRGGWEQPHHRRPPELRCV